MLPLWDKLGRRRNTPVTGLLLTLIFGVFLAQIIVMLVMPDDASKWLDQFALVPGRWSAAWRTWPGWIPVITSAFLHGGLAHVVGNAWFLWVFGRSLEEHIGAASFALIYIGGMFGAGLAQIAADPASVVPMVGASGAISAVMGAYFVKLPTRWIISVVPWVVPILPVPAVVFLVLWFAMQIVQGVDTLGVHASGGVAWWAHAGGFVTGVVMGLSLRNKTAAKPKSRRRVKT